MKGMHAIINLIALALVPLIIGSLVAIDTAQIAFAQNMTSGTNSNTTGSENMTANQTGGNLTAMRMKPIEGWK